MKKIVLIVTILLAISCSNENSESSSSDESTVTINNKVWSKYNLDVTTYSDGTPIPQVTSQSEWINLTTGAWCYYNNDPANGEIYGKLYNYYAVEGKHDNDPNTPYKQLAPNGWHIPSNDEWRELVNHLDTNANGGSNYYNQSGSKMKTTGTIESGTGLWITPNLGANNESGFSGLPAGYRSIYTSTPLGFYGIKSYTLWWVMYKDNDYGASSFNLYYDRTGISKSYYPDAFGLSVRCIKN
jgi:uncharacterized protein (TIGR02145 family)